MRFSIPEFTYIYIYFSGSCIRHKPSCWQNILLWFHNFHQRQQRSCTEFCNWFYTSFDTRRCRSFLCSLWTKRNRPRRWLGRKNCLQNYQPIRKHVRSQPIKFDCGIGTGLRKFSALHFGCGSSWFRRVWSLGHGVLAVGWTV